MWTRIYVSSPAGTKAGQLGIGSGKISKEAILGVCIHLNKGPALGICMHSKQQGQLLAAVCTNKDAMGSSSPPTSSEQIEQRLTATMLLANGAA